MKKTRFEELMNYYNQTRQAGHTTFMIDGINFERYAVFLFANNANAQDAFRKTIDRYRINQANFAQLKIENIQFATIGWLNNLEENLRGRSPFNMPVVAVDHFALQILVDEHVEAIKKREDEQEEK